MPFSKLQWLFPIAVALHNGEEAIWMPAWDAEHAARLPVHPGAEEIRIALAVLTVAALAVTYLSVRKGPNSIWAYLTFGYIVTMLVNVFVPHVPVALVFHGYAPGVVTAVLVNLPLTSFLALKAVREGWVRGRKAAVFAVAVPVTLALMIGAFFFVGEAGL